MLKKLRQLMLSKSKNFPWKKILSKQMREKKFI